VNLLGNAIKFTCRGEIAVKCTSNFCEEKKMWEIRIAVMDQGRGISKDILTKIWNPYIQANSSSGGFGLGLSISKKLVELMGGTLGVESEEGNGTTFFFTFYTTDAIPSKLLTETPVECVGKKVAIIETHSNNKDVLCDLISYYRMKPIVLKIEEAMDLSMPGDIDLVLCCLSEGDDKIKSLITQFPFKLILMGTKKPPLEFQNIFFLKKPFHHYKFAASLFKFFQNQVWEVATEIPPLECSIPTPSHLNILIVEDYLMNQQVLFKMFKKTGNRENESRSEWKRSCGVTQNRTF